jgi:BolA family transcriptional regulator, general stress-responsive regulator
MDEPLADRIGRLLGRLHPLDLEVLDESHQHAGHPGARDGGGHFRVRLVSGEFSGLSRIQRHRLVYDCLADLMPRDIHALAMILLTPEEAAPAGTHSPPRK